MVRDPGRAAVTGVLWVLSRGLVLLLYVGPQHWVTGDVAYFADGFRALPQQGIARTFPEYPLAGVGALALPWSLARLLGGGPDTCAWLLLGLVLAADGLFTVLLHRADGPGRTAGLAVWLLGVPALGATVLARFDMLPAVLAGAGVMLLAGRARLAALAVTAAAAVKVWPALLLPALAARRGTRGPVLRMTVGVGAAVVVGSLLVAGWGRLVSPLLFQTGRGLQIEAVLASPAMVGWLVAPHRFAVGYAPTHAFEVTGPGVPVLVHLCTVLTVLVAAFLAAVWCRLWRSGADLAAVAWAGFAAVSGFMVTSRVLSPQYLLWLLPLAAGAVAVTGRHRGALTRWSALLVLTCVLTQLEFPVGYANLVSHQAGSAWTVAVLVARNVLLVWLCGEAAVRAWRAAGAAQRGRELARQPPGPDGNVARSLR